MKIHEVLRLLKQHKVDVGSDTLEPDGSRVLVFGCALPDFPWGKDRFCYTTLVLSPGEDDVKLEEREAIRRRLHHLTTDIFGDDEIEASEGRENYPIDEA